MKILIIEDDKFFRKFYVEKLRTQGFQVDEAENGEEGIESMRKNRPNLVILDIIIPKKDGFEVLSAIKNDSALHTIPVLVFSTLGQESDVEKAKQLGAKDYINKSLLDFNDLLIKINSLIKK